MTTTNKIKNAEKKEKRRGLVQAGDWQHKKWHGSSLSSSSARHSFARGLECARMRMHGSVIEKQTKQNPENKERDKQGKKNVKE